ncbi:hypothetical protein Ddye_009509 [Dipteronia dyeriana]|uniref:non-specific serine/threonine protein kinase n=1 Tax=Dipteronia dyeriana TaxID=168575 RepID=A0AAE0CMB5_9ROSI|nr:hypothetical protein Ddye_009509 [Dipteronia dyeriana]
MENALPFIFLISLFAPPCTVATDHPSCLTSCGSLQLKYPFGSGYGCGSPRIDPYVTCSAEPSNQLYLTTHTGSYPITSISYTTSTITITPPYMSTCTSMQQSSSLGLDWASPFQLGPSIFLLLSCTPPTSSLHIKGSLVCDPSSSHLCTSFYTCPSVIGLGLPLFPPTNTCCVYSPANLNGEDELDVKSMECGGYTSVASLKDYPTDPTRWEYGVLLTYTHGAFDHYYIDNKCNGCEESGGVCGYSTVDNDSFVCVCNNGVNTTTQCSNFSDQDESIFWSSASLKTWKSSLGILAGHLLFTVATYSEVGGESFSVEL